ncbi:MAG TPA: alpha/beta fold hydrolase [Steroidobacteraceae bacterium]|nr:alpha/beta fold hydrolase [Steroidobacteraceae bacterium]
MSAATQRFVQRNVQLERGGVLPVVETAYLTRGRLESDASNAVLVTHGYTSGPDMIESTAYAAEGAWDAIVGPGQPIDTDRYFVVCPNALGSSFGSTNASSVEPATGKPYGSRFPEITVKDIVAGQKALLEQLGIHHLCAVIGPSFGGAQVFQWGVDFPDCVAALVAVLCAPSMQGNPAQIEARLAGDPHWKGGDYYETGGMEGVLEEMRAASLRRFGIDAVLEQRIADEAERARELSRLARNWAQRFDANSLLILMKTMARFNVTDQLHRIRAPLLYVLSRTDHIFPPSLAPAVLEQLKNAGVSTQYFEIDSEYGHFASSADAAKWTPTLREFLRGIAAFQTGRSPE